jgi:hypothetical protein
MIAKMSPDLAVNIVWLVWYVPWIAAVVWSAKTKTQMGTDIQGAHRLLSGLGIMLLFFVPAISGGKLFGSTLLGLFATKLWHDPAWAAWSLVALTVAAFGFCWWARLHLGRLWSGFVTLKAGPRVIDTGPYAASCASNWAPRPMTPTAAAWGCSCRSYAEGFADARILSAQTSSRFEPHLAARAALLISGIDI